MFLPIAIAFLVVFVTIGLFIFLKYGNIQTSMLRPVNDESHVIISGGSKGIGKALAIRYAQLGAHVTIIARTMSDLKSAKSEIEKARRRPQKQRVNTVSLDLTKVTFPNTIKDKLNSEQQKHVDTILGDHRKCDILINCCGSATSAKFTDVSQADFKFMMDINYFSAINLTRLIIPFMVQKKKGQIVFVSSMCGLFSFYGYSAYSASKFALVGMAEALNMEMRPHGISVTVSFPGDTKTPGFDSENVKKPELTKFISRSSTVHSAEAVATGLINDITCRRFQSTYGIENMAVLVTLGGFMPDSLFNTLMYSFIAPPMRILSYLIVKNWYCLVTSYAQTKPNI